MHRRKDQRGILLSHPRCAPNRHGAGALKLPVIEWPCDWCRGLYLGRSRGSQRMCFSLGQRDASLGIRYKVFLGDYYGVQSLAYIRIGVVGILLGAGEHWGGLVFMNW